MSEKVIRDCVASMAGYRRELNDKQPCDAEKAAMALLERKDQPHTRSHDEHAPANQERIRQYQTRYRMALAGYGYDDSEERRAFLKLMESREYGDGPLMSAWAWFREGRESVAASETARSNDSEDAERYRWLRDQCTPMRRMVIMEQIEGDPGHMLDHHIDKGRCGL